MHETKRMKGVPEIDIPEALPPLSAIYDYYQSAFQPTPEHFVTPQ
jgi:hypothetical protein